MKEDKEKTASKSTTNCNHQQQQQQQQQQEEDNTSTTMTVGGEKGHVVEVLHHNNAALLIRMFQTYRWKPIPNCTGRYTCRDHTLVTHKRPKELLLRDSRIPVATDGVGGDGGGSTAAAATYVLDDNNNEEVELVIPGRDDKIIILPLDNDNRTGIITYVKNEKNNHEVDGVRYVHTLNTPSGFRRKLDSVGVHVDSGSIKLL